MATPKKAEPKEEEFVTVEQFSKLEDAMGKLIDIVSKQAKTPTEIVKEKEVEKAAPNKYSINPEWEEMAREIIGEGVDHTELTYAKGGGQIFTIVIKKEFSNAPDDYLGLYKVDRRSKEIGAEGESGVRIWCELVKENLKREKPYKN